MTYATALDIYGLKLNARCDDPQLAEGLQRLLRLFVLPNPDPDSWQLSLSAFDGNGNGGNVQRQMPSNGGQTAVNSPGGRVVVNEDAKIIEAHIVPDMQGWVVLLFQILSVLQRSNIFVIHSAAFADGRGRGFLFPGNHSSGKTTLTFTALRAGCKIVCDDLLLMRKDGQDICFLPFLSVLSLEEGRPVKALFDVLEHYPNEVFQPVINPRFVMFPKIVEQPETSMEVIPDKREVFNLLLAHSLLAQGRSRQVEQLKILWQLAGMMLAYKLFLGRDHHASPELLHEFIKPIEVVSR